MPKLISTVLALFLTSSASYAQQTAESVPLLPTLNVLGYELGSQAVYGAENARSYRTFERGDSRMTFTTELKIADISLRLAEQDNLFLVMLYVKGTLAEIAVSERRYGEEITEALAAKVRVSLNEKYVLQKPLRPKTNPRDSHPYTQTTRYIERWRDKSGIYVIDLVRNYEKVSNRAACFGTLQFRSGEAAAIQSTMCQLGSRTSYELRYKHEKLYSEAFDLVSAEMNIQSINDSKKEREKMSKF